MGTSRKKIDDNQPYVLPSDNSKLLQFIEKYKVDMTEQVVSSIEFAVKYKLPVIEVFQFKNSKFVITLSPSDFDINLESIYKYYLDTERYELCKRIVELRKKIDKNINEKEKRTSIGDI